MQLPWVKKNKKAKTRNPSLMQGQDSYIFRRSRTITGTKSADITASAPARGQFKTDRIKLMQLRQHRRRILRFLSGVLCAVAVLSFLVVNFVITPQLYFAQTGARQPDANLYSKSIYSYYDNHPFERFGFMLRQPEFETHMLRAHPEMRAITIERDWYGGNVRFNVTFRQPLIAWKTGLQQFYVDAQGVAFNYNHFTEPALFVTDQSGIPPDSNGVVASTRFIRFLGQIVAAINDYGLGEVESVVIPQATRQIDLKLKGRGYIIKTNTDRDPAQQAEDIVNTLKYIDRTAAQPQYIDARVPHKAFFK